MDTKVNYTIVGAFVISLMACIVFVIIWLSSGFSSGGPCSLYEIYMTESVSGLNIDANVEFNGVNVGVVKKIEIDPTDLRLVVVLLSIKSSTPITQGTRATLRMKGLTGIAYVALEDDGIDLKPLIIKPGHHYPAIATSPSFFWRLDTALTKINENFSKVTHSLESLLDEENLQSLKEILIDIKHVTRTLAANTTQISDLLHNAAAASDQLVPVLQSTQTFINTMNRQLLPAASKALLNLDLITNDLSAVSHEIKDNPAVIIRGKTAQPLGPGEK